MGRVKLWSHPAVLACACSLLAKTWAKIWKFVRHVRGEYRLSTDLGVRRHDAELLVKGKLSLRAGYVRATDLPHVRARTPSVLPKHAQRTDSVRLLRSLPRPLPVPKAHLVSACWALISAWPVLTRHLPNPIIQMSKIWKRQGYEYLWEE